jgi:hypothetical protein
MAEDFLHLQQIHMFSSQHITGSELKAIEDKQSKGISSSHQMPQGTNKACITSRIELAARDWKKRIQHRTQQ